MKVQLSSLLFCSFKIQIIASQMAEFTLQVKPGPEAKPKHFDKQQQRIFDILRGKLHYPSVQFRDFDLTPDLIIKVTVPNSQFISRKDYLQLSSYVTLPSQRLQRAFQKAEKIIIDEMNAKKENTDPSNLKIRLQKALVSSKLRVKTARFINEYNEEEPLQFQSIYEHSGELDSFTLEYNAILYILQHVCGFRVRSFLLYDQQQENKEIFLFLTLSAENLINIAKRYRIKKEIDYTFLDFYLNDPIGKDERPLKYSSSVKTDQSLLKPIKSINRYFRVNNTAHETTDIIQEAELDEPQAEDFRDYIEEITEVFEYFKYKQVQQISNKQKSYIFQYNRRKYNIGCERMYALLKQRRDFFQLNKQVLQKYGYPYEEEPLVYEEFHLPDKNSKQSSFFDKLYSLLLYKPMKVTPQGDLDLFLNMERTKLAYLLVKNHFKVSYLKKMGFDFLTLSSNFEKFGQRGEVKGGINGKILEQEWSIYGIYSNIDTIRNYLGDAVGFQIMITNQLLLYFMIVFLPFSLLYIIQELFGSSFYLYTTLMETLLYAISQQIFLFFWNLNEQEYIKNYSDSISSKIFLNDYRGPYRRNVLTDEVNQFQTERGVWTTLMNTLCAVIIIALLVIMGAVFHGCRMMLVEIYDPLSHLVVSRISLPHIIAYLLFFVVSNLAGVIATNRILSFMVNYLQNPTSDQEKEDWWYILRFFYLIGLELIPPFFFFILEPFSGTSCYSDSCESEIEFFVYSRILYTFIIQAFRLVQVFIFNYLRLKEFFKKKQAVVYQEKLSGLLSKTLKESKKKEHVTNINETLILLTSYSIYCNVLPLISVLSLVAFFMHHTNTRLGVLYEERRPINRSQKISSFLKLANKIFYIGIILQAWVSVFLFEFVESNFQEFVQKLSTTVTNQGVFLFKIFCVFVYFLILYFLSRIIGGIVQGYTNDAILKRKDNKYKQFVGSRGRMKTTIKKAYEPLPVKTMFRTFNPEKTNQEKIDDIVYGNKGNNVDYKEEDEMQVDSLINITLKHLNDK